MKKTYLFANAVLVLLILIGDVFYTLNGFVWLKALTSLCFVMLGFVNLVYLIKSGTNYRKFAIFMLVGLIFSFAGDVMLEFIFELGAGLFAIGHIFYFVAYSTLIKFKWVDLVPALVIIIPVVLLITLSPLFDFGGIFMEIVCIIYAIIISLMVGKAISNLIRERTLLNIVLVVGSILFMFSDLMLLFSNFADVSRLFGILCLATYYPGQIVLALSLVFAKK